MEVREEEGFSVLAGFVRFLPGPYHGNPHVHPSISMYLNLATCPWKITIKK